MAHEFNNPLGIVMGFTQDLMSETDPSDPHYRSLKIIDDESKRCERDHPGPSAICSSQKC